MSYISFSLLLICVILQISNLEAILQLGHFFYTPCRVANNLLILEDTIQLAENTFKVRITFTAQCFATPVYALQW